MRDIKFRGIKYGTTEFIYGDFQQDKDGRCYIKEIGTAVWNSINPDTIGQYTGLKDKSGKEIFEGDVIKNHQGSVSVLDWDKRTARFKPRSFYNRESWYWQQNEIIGNIHENPELLNLQP